MSILWTIIIGFIAGVIAKFIMPGDNEPSGFILTTILGIVGAFVASYLGGSFRMVPAGGGRRTDRCHSWRNHRPLRVRLVCRSATAGTLKPFRRSGERTHRMVQEKMDRC